MIRWIHRQQAVTFLESRVMIMTGYEEILEGIYLLKTPFPPVWSGSVIVKGKEICLIDTGASTQVADTCIVPALKELNVEIGDIDWLLNTHCHGDHIGGHARIKELCPDIKVAVCKTGEEALKDPVKNAVRIRTKYPKYSPPPQAQLHGVKIDRVLEDWEQLTDRIAVISTPGHDSDCCCWYDRQTKTLITGDSLQGNGTITQGIGFYQSLDDYEYTLDKLDNMDVDNIINGHDYDQIGDVILGSVNARKALHACMEYVNLYNEIISTLLANGVTDSAEIAKVVIDKVGCGKPSYLFMSIYTVDNHKRRLLNWS